MLAKLEYSSALKERNFTWEKNVSIPKWVNIGNVGLDQFFTKPIIAKYCLDSLMSFIGDDNNFFIEPSAGSGSFYDLLPEDKIGLDIMPMHPDIIKQDFLSWEPEKTSKKLIYVGNPPFGYRAWLALSFMNRAAKHADYIGFILPMSFQSDGKGSPKNRVRGMSLLHSEILPQDSFFDPDGKVRKVNALWQVWKKGENKTKKTKTCKRWIEIFTVDMRKERLCGQKKIHEADYFLQRTYYRQPPQLVKCFSDVKYVCGYGLKIKKDQNEILSILKKIDWDEYSNLAAHNCRHISMYHINKALTDNGYTDD